MLMQLPFGHSEEKLLIESALLDQLREFRQIAPDASEAGGILMGYRRGPHTHVTEATMPSKEDVQHRFGFLRQAKYHHQTAVRRWKETGETLDYAGEWHTHPEDDPSPSNKDIRNWRKITMASQRPMIFVIIGRSTNWIGAGLGQRVVQIDLGLFS